MTACTHNRRDDYPRLDHIERHLPDRARPFLPHLLEPITQSQVAEHMGPGWTRRQVEEAWRIVQVALGLPLAANGATASALSRMTLLRMALGLDPCWCEVMADDLRGVA